MVINWTLKGALWALAFALLMAMCSPDAEGASRVSGSRAGPGVVVAGSSAGLVDGAAGGAAGGVVAKRRHLAGKTVAVTVDGLRFRSGPGTGYTIRGLLYSGDRLYVREEYAKRDRRGEWIGVRVKRSVTGLGRGSFGYVHRSYVRVVR